MKFEGLKQLSEEDVADIEKEKDIEALQTEEKGFLGKIKESERDVFHFSPRENFKKAMRTVALATVLLAPVGEKAFAERTESPKEQTVAMAQLDQESGQLEKEDDLESLDPITEQREIIKAKYDAEIIGDNSEYTLEELQDFEDALEKVQEFAPEKYDELKIVLMKSGFSLFPRMIAFPNICDDLEKIEVVANMKKHVKVRFDGESKIFDEMINLRDDNENIKNNYDIIFGQDKKVSYKDKGEDEEMLSSDFATIPKDYYKNTYTHEIGHLITMNNDDNFSILSDKFSKINKKIPEIAEEIFKIDSTELENKLLDSKTKIVRILGFVSIYAGGNYNNGERKIPEDIAETFTYMVNDYHYADYDPIVQEKVKVLQEFLNEKSNE
ncbi:hypothetical protein HOB87_03920 [Candidatus Woesearchaeota archaeon]|jgi:hypothetical protein|nr:hypothetical protein [Candidatus Woesearchaeota archaeon]